LATVIPARIHRSIARSIVFGVIRSNRARQIGSAHSIAACPRYTRHVFTDHRCGDSRNASSNLRTVMAALCGNGTIGVTPYNRTSSPRRHAALSSFP